jgi:hypothetical protein
VFQRTTGRASMAIPSDAPEHPSARRSGYSPLVAAAQARDLRNGDDLAELGSTDDMALVGIIKAWNPGAKKPYLKATQIQHWLSLVGGQIPELRPVIKAAFPIPTGT